MKPLFAPPTDDPPVKADRNDGVVVWAFQTTDGGTVGIEAPDPDTARRRIVALLEPTPDPPDQADVIAAAVAAGVAAAQAGTDVLEACATAAKTAERRGPASGMLGDVEARK
jgi:hypothetical protein